MNRELMEKIAKRIVEDPNYPYGNKLKKRHSVKEALEFAVPMSSIGTRMGAVAGVLPGLAAHHPIKGAGYGAIAGTALVGGTSFLSEYDRSEGNRAISYLPSGEQLNLFKKMKSMNDEQARLRDNLEKIDYPYDWEKEDLPYIHEDYKRLKDIESQQNKLWQGAQIRGKALMLAEKKNHRLFKKASDYLDDAVMEKQASTTFSRYMAKNPEKVLAYISKRNALNEGQEAIKYMLKEKELTRQPFSELSIKDKNLRKIWGRFRKSFSKDAIDNMTKHNKVPSLETIKARAAYRKNILDKYKTI